MEFPAYERGFFCQTGETNKRGFEDGERERERDNEEGERERERERKNKRERRKLVSVKNERINKLQYCSRQEQTGDAEKERKTIRARLV